MPASGDERASSRSEGADDRTAEEVVAAAGADSLETCSAMAAAISREVLRLPASAKATIASLSSRGTRAAIVAFRSRFTSLSLLTATGSPRRRQREPQPTQVGDFFGSARRYSRRDGEGFSVAEPRRDLRPLRLDELPAAGADSRSTWPLGLETGGEVLELRRTC